MPNYTTADIRNIALVGGAGCGKTTLVEAILHATGIIGSMGSVEKGDTTSDFTDEEKGHGCSFFCSAVHCDHKGKHINIIDSPGSPDFIGHALSVMPAVETMAMVINAAAGIESISRRLMDRAAERNLCRMIIINKIDSENINLPELIENIQKTFGSQCLPINLPQDDGTKVIDCFSNSDGDSDLGSVSDAHTAIIEQVVAEDESLMEIYLEQGDVKPEQLFQPLMKAMRDGSLIPICFISSKPHDNPQKPVGIEQLLDVVVNQLPNPIDGSRKPFTKGGEICPVEPDADKNTIAHVFNVRVDPFVGKLSAFRVHQGTITNQTMLFVSDPSHGVSKKAFKVSHLFKLQGKEHKETDTGVAGDIVAVAKIDEVRFNAVLHESHDVDEIQLTPIHFPEPMSGLAVTPKRRGDEQKIGDALAKLVEEDPTFKVTRDSVTNETVIHGMGDLHLRVILEKLKGRFNVEVDTKPPKIAYRETIQGKAEGHHRHKKQTGGAGQFGEVYLRVEPMDRGSGFEFVNDIFGGSIPNQFLPAVEKGIRQAMEQGAIAGYPMQDIRVSVYDGKHHPVDSKEVAFVTAGKRAFIDAVMKARPALLEPMVNVEVTVPSQYMGDITGDLSGKRGRIQGTDMLAGDQVSIQAVVPLAEIGNYQGQLKSVTGGQGSFTMELSHYDPVPPHVQEQIAAQYKPRDEED